MWDGGTAHQLGLVDGFGGLPDAIAKAAQLAGLGTSAASATSSRRVSSASADRDPRVDSETEAAPVPEDAFASLAREPQQQLAAMIGEIRSMLGGPSIQARCLECPPVAPGALRQARPQACVGALRS